jgi:hypothetical protein
VVSELALVGEQTATMLLLPLSRRVLAILCRRL